MRLLYVLLVALLALFVGNSQGALRRHHEDHHLVTQAAPAELSLPSFAVHGQAKSLAGMGWHFLVLQPNGEVFGTGWNSYMQLVTNTITEYAFTPQKAAVSSVVDVAAGDAHSCLVIGDTTRQVQCVGHGAQGQLGRGVNASSPELQPVSGALEGVLEVYCGTYTSLAIMLGSGQVYAWGTNLHGGLGVGSNGSAELVPALVSLPSGFNTTQVGAGRDNSCFLSTLGDMHCAGAFSQGRLGDDGLASTSVSIPVAVDVSLLSEPGTTKFVSLAAGQSHTCATATDNKVYCWGQNNNFQLGTDVGASKNKPTPVAGISNARSVWAGNSNTFVIDNSASNGGAVAFGSGAFGVFGNGGTSRSATPVQFGQSVTGIVEIRGGQIVTCILKQSGEVFCTGNGEYGQFGKGDCLTNSLTLVQWGTPCTSQPTFSPTSSPTSSTPTMNPTSSPPTKAPTNTPSFNPTSSQPTSAPTRSAPTKGPTSSAPTQAPTRSPTGSPTSSTPTLAPTTRTPTNAPTSSQPTTSLQPTTAAPVSSEPAPPVIVGAVLGAIAALLVGLAAYACKKRSVTKDDAAGAHVPGREVVVHSPA